MGKAAVIQLNSDADVQKNLAAAEELIRKAAREGANLIATPENTPYMGPAAGKIRIACHYEEIVTEFSNLAKELKVYLLLGSLYEPAQNSRKVKNTSLLFRPDGSLAAKYSKIHLFDVDLPGLILNRESDTVEAGTEVVVADTTLGKLGLSICFDLRFPSHYEELRQKGAQMLAVPAAFTAHTGKTHWEILLKSRAIETQNYVLAPAQVGSHGDEGLKESFGNSMIIDPWGTIVARVEGDRPGYAVGEIDMEFLEKVRREMPLY